MKKYAKNVYSQNGEDGIIEEILKRLKIKSKGVCCEFGAWNGHYFSNTYNLVKNKGWRAIYMEGDPEKYPELLKTCSETIGIIPIQVMVEAAGDNSLDNILNFYKTRDINVLSIDVDGPDYFIWESLKDFQPAIVVIEISSGLGVEVEQISPTEGSSFASMLKLGNSKGYDLVAHTGNMIFVRNDLTEDLFENINSNALFYA